MFCYKCGTQLDNNSAFCSACGAGQKGVNTSAMRPVAVIIAAVIAVLSVTKYMCFLWDFTDQREAFSGFSLLMDFGEYMDKSEDLAVGVMFFVVFNLWISISSLWFLIVAFTGKLLPKRSFRVIRGSGCMTSVIICFILCSLLMLAVNSELPPGVKFTYSFQGWIIPILAAVNRFFILPAYLRSVKVAVGNNF